MGVPYSREIGAALDEVGPLIQKIHYIAYLVFALQIITIALLFLVFLAVIALTISIIPALSDERDALVTPVIKWPSAEFDPLSKPSAS
jgi:hypothetical protein